MIGETISFMPTLAGSLENAAFGTVSRFVVSVTQGLCNPLLAVVQLAGKAGAVTASKFSEKSCVGLPRISGKLTVPRFTAPSCNCNRAVIVPPHEAFAVKVNGWLTA